MSMATEQPRIHILYRNHFNNTYRQAIAGFSFDGINGWMDVYRMPAGTKGSIRCIKCNANDWTENGRSINEYECGCCGAFITVEPKN